MCVRAYFSQVGRKVINPHFSEKSHKKYFFPLTTKNDVIIKDEDLTNEFNEFFHNIANNFSILKTSVDHINIFDI